MIYASKRHTIPKIFAWAGSGLHANAQMASVSVVNTRPERGLTPSE